MVHRCYDPGRTSYTRFRRDRNFAGDWPVKANSECFAYDPIECFQFLVSFFRDAVRAVEFRYAFSFFRSRFRSGFYFHFYAPSVGVTSLRLIRWDRCFSSRENSRDLAGVLTQLPWPTYVYLVLRKCSEAFAGERRGIDRSCKSRPCARAGRKRRNDFHASFSSDVAFCYANSPRLHPEHTAIHSQRAFLLHPRSSVFSAAALRAKTLPNRFCGMQTRNYGAWNIHADGGRSLWIREKGIARRNGYRLRLRYTARLFTFRRYRWNIASIQLRPRVPAVSNWLYDAVIF